MFDPWLVKVKAKNHIKKSQLIYNGQLGWAFDFVEKYET